LDLNDYLIEPEGIDWPKALDSWKWLLPKDFDLWLVTRFGDCFLEMTDGEIHLLNVGDGTLTEVAESGEEFATKMENEDNFADWLMAPLVDLLAEKKVKLKKGQCYGFKVLPVLGGEFEPKNIAPISIIEYLGASGEMHSQLKDVADGAQVQIETKPKRKRKKS